MIVRWLSPGLIPLLVGALACSEATAPDHFTPRNAAGVYFAVTENDSTYPQPLGRDSVTGCVITSVGGYMVLNSDNTYHGALFGLHSICPGGSVGGGAMLYRGTYEVRDTAIRFHEQLGSIWDFSAKPTSSTRAGPDLEVTRRNWSSYPSRLYLQREPNVVAAERRIEALDIPSGLEYPAPEVRSGPVLAALSPGVSRLSPATEALLSFVLPVAEVVVACDHGDAA